jgi:hypothetical protein
VSAASLPPGRKRALQRLLEEVAAGTTCLEKLRAAEGFVREVERGRGRWLPEALAAPWLEAGQDLVDGIGPCALGCREEGGIEGANLALSGALSALGARVMGADAPSCEGCTPAGLAIDGDPGTVWVAPGEGAELVVDLGARQVVKGARVVGPYPQSYRVEVWDHLNAGWTQVARRSAPVEVGLEDFCDTQTRFVRLVNEGTEGSGDTLVGEFEVYGARPQFERREWPGADPELAQQVGQASGDGWEVGASDIGWAVTGPHAKLGTGKRWVRFHLGADGPRADGEAVARVMVVRESQGQRVMLAEALVYGLDGENPRTLEFEAEAGSRYSFAVYQHGGARLSVERILVKDRAGTFTREPFGYLVETGGRRIEVRQPGHALDGAVIRMPRMSASGLLSVEVGPPGVPVGLSSAVGPAVRLRTEQALSGADFVRVRMPLDLGALREAGIHPRELALEVSGPGRELETLERNFGRWWRVPLPPPGPLDLELRPVVEHELLPWRPADPGGPTPPPEGFAADYLDYNLVHFTLNDRPGSRLAVDSSPAGRIGHLVGDAGYGSGGVYGGALRLRGGRVETDIGRVPGAFALELWLRVDELGVGDKTIVAAQAVNFRLVAERVGFMDQSAIILHLEVYHRDRNEYRVVATTVSDTSVSGGWHHVVALFDGHFKGRIYVDGRVNAHGIRAFEAGLQQPLTGALIADGPFWPRRPGTSVGPLVLGRPSGMLAYRPFVGRLDEVRFSDLTRFRVNDAPTCPPRCRPGEHGSQGVPGNRYHTSSSDWYPPGPVTDTDDLLMFGAPMHQRDFPFRLPYVQDVSDHSALVVWRSQCEPKQVHVGGASPVDIVFLPSMTFCLGEAGRPMDRCSTVMPSWGLDTRSNYPDCQYAIRVGNLRPSTWYHYRVREDTLVHGELSGWYDYELASDAHFRTASLASEDPFSFIAFGDFSPKMEANYWGCFSCWWRSTCCTEECYEGYRPTYDRAVARWLYESTDPARGAETPAFWLAPGDLAQTSYNEDNFEAYLFGIFNRVKGPRAGEAMLFNGALMGMPIYGALGNHNWSACFYWSQSASEGSSASVQMGNLFPPDRRLAPNLNRRFRYGRSSYSFDHGNLHVVSLGGAQNSHFLMTPETDASTVGLAQVDKAAHVGEWNYGVESPWTERLSQSGKQKDTEQIVWLKRDLFPYHRDEGVWKVVFLHAPLTTEDEGEDAAGDPARARLLLLLQEAGVDLVITGHRHVYRREQSGPVVQDRLLRDTPQEQWAAHFIVGTGGYCHEDDEGCPPEAWGLPRFFVDGNALFSFYDDLAAVPGCESCLLLKGVEGLYKSQCQPLGLFPPEECSGRAEGQGCTSLSAGRGPLPGRCIRPRLNWWTQLPCDTDREGHPFVPWNELRCIPFPTGEG